MLRRYDCRKNPQTTIFETNTHRRSATISLPPRVELIHSRSTRPIGSTVGLLAISIVAGIVLSSALIASVKLLLIAALIGALAALLCKRNHEHTVGLK